MSGANGVERQTQRQTAQVGRKRASVGDLICGSNAT